jgi:amidase
VIAPVEALDPRINAVVVRDFERAHTAAAAAGSALARGERAPLLGVPVTVRKLFTSPFLGLAFAGLPPWYRLATSRNREAQELARAEKKGPMERKTSSAAVGL